jgi:hypothetical protein
MNSVVFEQRIFGSKTIKKAKNIPESGFWCLRRSDSISKSIRGIGCGMWVCSESGTQTLISADHNMGAAA